MALPPILKDRLRLPVIAAPLFIISHPPLVVAQSKAGVVGSFPALNARTSEELDAWLDEIREALDAHDRDQPERPAAPFAVNQIVHRSNSRLEADLEICVKHRVPIVITSLGARPEVNDAVHSYGGIVLHDVIHDRFAHKAVDKGADGLIAVAAGAGGHAGSLSPFALVQEIREWYAGPLFLSGSIATGGAILAAQAMGADGAYVGSAFIATDEARASADYKAAIVASRADDIVYTDYFTGVHGNYLRASIEAAGLDPEALPQGERKAMDFGERDGGGEPSGSDAAKPKPWKDIWGSGQGIGAVRASGPAEALVDRLMAEYAHARETLGLG